MSYGIVWLEEHRKSPGAIRRSPRADGCVAEAKMEKLAKEKKLVKLRKLKTEEKLRKLQKLKTKKKLRNRLMKELN
jgi:hypothetical protein